MPVPSDVYPIVESTQLHFSHGIGVVSLLVNSATLFIVIHKASILDKEIRRLAVFLEASCLLENVFYTICFIPFHYPRAGAGYCLGALCGIVPYPALLLMFSILTMNMYSLFGIMIIARHQMLQFDDSRFKMTQRVKKLAYIYVILLFQCVSVTCSLTSFTASDRETQIRVLLNMFPQLHWQARGLNWYLFNRAGNPKLLALVNVGLCVIIPMGCTLVVAPFVHIIIIVLRARKRAHSQQHVRIHLRSTQTVIIQFTVHIIFLAVPIFIITIVGLLDNIYAETQTLVVIGQALFACSTLANSYVVVVRNRAYLSTITSWFRRKNASQISLNGKGTNKVNS